MTVCEAITDKLIDDLTGNLTDAEKAEVDRHIVTCETCRRESETLRQMWTIMGSDGDGVNRTDDVRTSVG